MAIMTRSELEARLGADDVARLADRDALSGEESTAVDAALSDAEAEVMGYVRAVAASIPDPAPDVLKRLVAMVARYNLFRRAVPEDDPVYVAYRDAVRDLTAIAKGTIALPLPDSTEVVETTSSAVGYAPSRHFTDAALSDMLPEARL